MASCCGWLLPRARSHDVDAERSLLLRVEEARRKQMPSRIVLVRHGESEANADHTLWRTKADNAILLTQAGHEQAFAAGKRIRQLIGDETVGFCCSPFSRTVQTMRGIKEAWGASEKNPPSRAAGARSGWVTIDSQLREQEFGNLQVLLPQAPALTPRRFIAALLTCARRDTRLLG